jgi:tetratricopeptide (TPR) repeat protein
MAKFLEKILKISFYFLFFLFPLFWLPFSFEKVEFSKNYLLWFLVSFSFLVWLAKMIFLNREIRWKKNYLNIAILIFLFFVILATIFSVDKNSSLFGSYQRFSNGFISLLIFIIFYFLLLNNPIDENLIKTFFVSVFLVVLIGILSIFGILAKIFPQVGQNFNLVSNSFEGLSVFLAIFLVFLVGKILILPKWGLKQIGYFILFFLNLFLLCLINFKVSWILLILSFSIFLIFVLIKRTFKENINRLLLPIFLIFLSLILLFVNISFLKSNQELILSQKLSWQISLSHLKEGTKNIILGSGPGTWQYLFSKFKPIEFNNTPLWNFRFDKSGSYLAEILGTSGILGTISYLSIIFLFILFFIFSKEKEFLVPATAFISAFLGQIFYYQNTSLAFLFWFFLALSISFKSQEKSYSFGKFPELSLVFSSFLIFILLLTMVFWFFAIKFYLADFNYNLGFLNPSTPEKIKFFEGAVKLNNYFPIYQIALSQANLLQVQEEILKDPKDRDLIKIQNSVVEAINRGKRATELSPKNVVCWETLAIVYRDIQPLVQGATEWAIKSFEEAKNLEPKNPVYWTEIGKLYLSSDIEKAKENFAKAKELKGDYLDALIQDALIFEREENLDEAIKRMEEIVRNFPFDIDANFQLGRLYYNKNRIDEAILQFERVVNIFPNHSNSLYSLGLIYSQKGEKEKAISYFEKVLKLNPGNEDVIQKINQLKGESKK